MIDAAPRASKIRARAVEIHALRAPQCRLSPTAVTRAYDGCVKSFVSITPIWLRLGLVLAASGATLYLAIEDRQPFRAIWLFFSSYQLGFMITWLILLVPCLAFIYALAALMHQRRRKADFPTARIHER